MRHTSFCYDMAIRRANKEKRFFEFSVMQQWYHLFFYIRAMETCRSDEMWYTFLWRSGGNGKQIAEPLFRCSDATNFGCGSCCSAQESLTSFRRSARHALMRNDYLHLKNLYACKAIDLLDKENRGNAKSIRNILTKWDQIFIWCAPKRKKGCAYEEKKTDDRNRLFCNFGYCCTYCFGSKTVQKFRSIWYCFCNRSFNSAG